MAYPSVISTFTNPVATDKLNNPAHSTIETAQNNELIQIENVVGIEGASSVVGSLQYLIKSPASDGGGHIQVANKGGTGQTSFTKGDLLVATSSSVIAKLGVGTDGLALIADSTQQAGIGWAAAPLAVFVASETITGINGPQNATNYITLASQLNKDATRTNAEIIVPRAGTLKYLYIQISANTANQSTAFTVLVNGSATTITTTVAASSGAVTSSDITHTATVAQGDKITLQTVSTSTAGALTIKSISLCLA